MSVYVIRDGRMVLAAEPPPGEPCRLCGAHVEIPALALVPVMADIVCADCSDQGDAL